MLFYACYICNNMLGYNMLCHNRLYATLFSDRSYLQFWTVKFCVLLKYIFHEKKIFYLHWYLIYNIENIRLRPFLNPLRSSGHMWPHFASLKKVLFCWVHYSSHKELQNMLIISLNSPSLLLSDNSLLCQAFSSSIAQLIKTT